MRRRTTTIAKNPPAEADCMYWLKHYEAAHVITALFNYRPDPDPPELQRERFRTIGRLAKQWLGYQKYSKAPQSVVRPIARIARRMGL